MTSFRGDKMKRIKRGDKVGRISHGEDIIFEVKEFIKKPGNKKIVILKGITERVEVDSPIEDLVLIEEESVNKSLRNLELEFEKKIKKNENNRETRTETFVTGKILHLDGDRRYSEKSLKYYQKVGLTAIVKNIPEYKQPSMVYNLLLYYKPDILVITRT